MPRRTQGHSGRAQVCARAWQQGRVAGEAPAPSERAVHPHECGQWSRSCWLRERMVCRLLCRASGACINENEADPPPPTPRGFWVCPRHGHVGGRDTRWCARTLTQHHHACVGVGACVCMSVHCMCVCTCMHARATHARTRAHTRTATCTCMHVGCAFMHAFMHGTRTREPPVVLALSLAHLAVLTRPVIHCRKNLHATQKGASGHWKASS